jgi:glutamate racemase
MVEAGLLAGAEVEASVREALAPLLGERDAAGEFVFPLPASARIDTLLLGCTHYPLLRAAIGAVAGDGIAIVDSAAATASALAELVSINGLEAPGRAATHVQLTTGDVAAFRGIAERMFGEAFPDVAGVELGTASGTPGAAAPVSRS